MKLILQNQFLTISVALSLLVHAIPLSVNFIHPNLVDSSLQSKLDIILVNESQNAPPPKADALAQANLNGGGVYKDMHAKALLKHSPIFKKPPQIKRKFEREIDSKHLLSSMASNDFFIKKPLKTKPLKSLDTTSAPNIKPPRYTTVDPAEIAINHHSGGKDVKKTIIGPNTKEVAIAAYYLSFEQRIQRLGELNFPRANRLKLYGELDISIPIFHDGSIYERDGGPKIIRSSGNPLLDNAAINIIRRAAPFGRFPPNMRLKYTDVWVLSAHFNFTKESAEFSSF